VEPFTRREHITDVEVGRELRASSSGCRCGRTFCFRRYRL
jgi:hypothetical protein